MHTPQGDRQKSSDSNGDGGGDGGGDGDNSESDNEDSGVVGDEGGGEASGEGGGEENKQAPQKPSYSPCFYPEQLKEDLEKISELLESMDTFLIMAFNIDGTAYINPQHFPEDNTVDQRQRDVLSIISEWMHWGAGYDRTLLIYNTVRKCTLGNENPALNWPKLFIKQGLVMPHILISDNGADVHLSNQYPSPFSELNIYENRAVILQQKDQAILIKKQHDRTVSEGYQGEETWLDVSTRLEIAAEESRIIEIEKSYYFHEKPPFLKIKQLLVTI